VRCSEGAARGAGGAVRGVCSEDTVTVQ
jgi:hypothetical protein